MSERLIMVTPDDVPTGSDSKVNGHLMSNILPPKSYLHRAFSAFIFRPSDGRLLLQKRADEKITFPSMWTNTCCSHPLWLDAEREEKGQMGVRRAVQRKLLHELGIPLETIKLDEMVYVTRIHYLAPSDGKWGEHEIDYVMFIVADVPLEPSPNEVSDTKYVSKDELEAFFKDPQNSFTPWFKLIAQSFLYKWWDHLLEGGKADLERVKGLIESGGERDTIQRMVE
ncbi:isopentenyl-diphosphate delta-isomerase [Atractiella rhizophila]|nr:isopentenyl-diphosphate delta-isomerase [Atractiella rhizophila]